MISIPTKDRYQGSSVGFSFLLCRSSLHKAARRVRIRAAQDGTISKEDFAPDHVSEIESIRRRFRF
jgi:hypothetical protein